MSQFHKPRETDYYLRIPTELVFVQVSISLSLHPPFSQQMALLSFSNPSDSCQSEVPSGFMLAYFLPPVLIYSMCVCECVCFHHTISVRVLQVFIEFGLPNLSQHMSAHTVSSRPITALSPFITSAKLNISVRWFFTLSMSEKSQLQTCILSFKIIYGHFNS